MTLNEYIENIKLEQTLNFDTNKCNTYVTDKARELGGNCVAVDDETVKQWIIEFANKPQEEQVKKKAEKEVEDGKDTQLQLF